MRWRSKRGSVHVCVDLVDESCDLDDLDLAPNAPRHALLRGHVIRTDGKRGLVEADVPRCIAALAQPVPCETAATAHGAATAMAAAPT